MQSLHNTPNAIEASTAKDIHTLRPPQQAMYKLSLRTTFDASIQCSLHPFQYSSSSVIALPSAHAITLHLYNRPTTIMPAPITPPAAYRAAVTAGAALSEFSCPVA